MIRGLSAGRKLRFLNSWEALDVAQGRHTRSKRIEQLSDNLGAVDVVVSEKQLRELDQVSQLPAEYPDGCSASGVRREPSS